MVALVRSIVVLYAFPVVGRRSLATAHKPAYQVVFWRFVIVFWALTWLGGCPIEYPYEGVSAVFAVLYFALVFLLMYV